MVMHAELTLRNDGETQLTRCAICGTEFEPVGTFELTATERFS